MLLRYDVCIYIKLLRLLQKYYVSLSFQFAAHSFHGSLDIRIYQIQQDKRRKVIPRIRRQKEKGVA